MKFFKPKIILPLILFPVFFACSALKNVKGEGPVSTETYQLEKPFKAILATSGWKVKLMPAKQSRLVVHTEKNLIPLLQYKIENGQLRISNKESIGKSKSRQITVYYKGNLSKIEASSGSEVYAPHTFIQKALTLSSNTGAKITLNLRTRHCSALSDAGGKMELHGSSRDFDVKAGTGAEIDARELQTITCHAKATTGGEIKVNVLEKLFKETGSGGKITYSGNPKEVRRKQESPDKNSRKDKKKRDTSKSTDHRSKSSRSQRK